MASESVNRDKESGKDQEGFDPGTGEIFENDAASKAIASAESFSDLSDLRAKLQTFGDYSRQRGMQLRQLNGVAEVKIEVECEIGRRLSAIEREPGERTDLTSLTTLTRFQAALKEGGWSRPWAMRWQIMSAWTTLADRKAYYAGQNEAEADITSADVYRMAKSRKSEAERSELKSRDVGPADGEYDTIVIDPPWDMQKIEREVRPNQVGFDYPTMSEDELAAFELPAADDCHLFCWTTHKFLPMTLRLLDAWDFRYVCTFVWKKPGGFQPIGLPQYNCEFAVYARKGSPKFVDTKSFFCCFDAPRREHSRKPDQFYDVVRRVTAGPRIDIFSREARDGFDQYGNEADKFGVAS